MISGVTIAYSVQSGFGIVEVSEVDFQATDGSNIHSTLQRPNYATASNRLPGVVVIHGVIQCKEWLMAFGIELARRGFVVLTIDANGHGNSDSGTGSGTAALEYIAGLDYVDTAQLGLIGHSMGGGISWSAIENSELTVRAIALVGSGVSGSANTTYPKNMLIAVGDFDELIYPLNFTYFETSFGVSPVESGVTYGNFNDGTARRLVIARTNHLFETIDPTIVSEITEWMKNSLKGTEEDEHWISQEVMIFPLWLVGGSIGLVGVVLTIFPVLAILIDLPIFSDLKKTLSIEYTADTRSYLGLGTLYGAIGMGLFLPLLGLGTILNFLIDFPQYQAIPIATWILGSALISALVLFLVVRRNKGKGLSWRKLWSISDQGSFIPKFLKTFLLGLIVTLWLYGWTLVVDLGLALDFRSFLPGFNDLTAIRALFVPFHFIFFFMYSFVDSIWLAGVLRRKPRDTWGQTQLKWTLEATFIKCVPYFIVISTQMGIGLLTGYPLAQDLIGFSLLFLFAFTPWFAVAAVIIMFCYQLTDNYYLGAILNALIFSWMLASILPVYL
jgi:dienelactone hydrolase